MMLCHVFQGHTGMFACDKPTLAKQICSSERSLTEEGQTRMNEQTCDHTVPVRYVVVVVFVSSLSVYVDSFI